MERRAGYGTRNPSRHSDHERRAAAAAHDSTIGRGNPKPASLPYRFAATMNPGLAGSPARLFRGERESRVQAPRAEDLTRENSKPANPATVPFREHCRLRSSEGPDR